MKILCAFNLYYYGTSELNSSYYFFVDTFLNMGHDVQILDFATLHKYGGDMLVSKLLLDEVFEFKPDVLFVVPRGSELPKWVIKYITRYTNTITIAWNSDDDRRWDNYSCQYISAYDYMITTYKSVWLKAKEEHKNLLLSQWACNQKSNRPLDIDKKYDCSFIGMAYYNRPDYIKRLMDEGLKVYFGGLNWDKYFKDAKTDFSQTDINIVTNQSKVSLVFSSGSDGKTSQLKGRVFESPGCKVCTFIEDAPDLDEYYTDGKEIVIFHNEDDLVKKLKYYLSNVKEREAIAEKGYKRTINEHTYELRFTEIFKTINKRPKVNSRLKRGVSKPFIYLLVRLVPFRRKIMGFSKRVVK